jgi:hypothetical protein
MQAMLTMDAVRISDDKQVMIKKLLPAQDNHDDDSRKELDIAQFLSSGNRQSDPRNHSLPYIDSFSIPDVEHGFFLVTPLYVPWNHPNYKTYGELIEFVRQVFEVRKCSSFDRRYPN